MLSNSKIEEVSPDFFVLDVVKFKNEEVSRNCCVFDVVNFEKMRKSRRIAWFSSWQIDR